jgi:hypothetical protein
MAARNPTTFDFTYDETALLPGSYVKTTVPDVIFDNQQFILDHATLLFADVWEKITVTGTTRPIRRLWAHFDMCGVATTHDVYAAFLCHGDGTAASTYKPEVSFRNVSGGPLTLQGSANGASTSLNWTAIAGPIAIKADGEEEFWIGLDDNSASVSQMSIAGIALYTAER